MSLEPWGDPPPSCWRWNATQPPFAKRKRAARGTHICIRSPAWRPVASLCAAASPPRPLTSATGSRPILRHLCEESGLAAEIEVESLPIDARATLEQALHGGEDYELLFTADPETVVPSSLEECWCMPLAG